MKYKRGDLIRFNVELFTGIVLDGYRRLAQEEHYLVLYNNQKIIVAWRDQWTVPYWIYIDEQEYWRKKGKR